ncbi:MAG TPA: alpha/beta fold hydrolase [Actinomycetota bacterium]|nr:alpha/beta fold hydrolase [Actinomycetota bacterium]
MPLTEVPLSIVCDGLRLRAAAVLPPEPRGVVVLLHGIPSIAPPDPDDEGYPGLARRLAAEGWAASWVDMRAAHGAPGFFSIEGWVRDARSVVDAARALDGAAGLPVALVGSSAGGAVAVEAAARGAPVDALVLLAAPAHWDTFAADPAEGVERIARDAGMSMAPEVHEDPSAWGDEFERVSPERSIAKVKVPVLAVHGSADDVVPVDHVRRIAERSSRVEARVLEGAGHRLRRDPEAIELVLDWLERRLG